MSFFFLNAQVEKNIGMALYMEHLHWELKNFVSYFGVNVAENTIKHVGLCLYTK